MKSRIEIFCCGRQYKHVHGQECPRQRRLQLTVRVCVCVCKYPRILHWREEIQLATLEWSEPPQRRVLITNQYWSETSVWEASCLSSPALHLSLFITLHVYLWFLVHKLWASSSNTLYGFSFYLPPLLIDFVHGVFICPACYVTVRLKGKPPHLPVMVPSSWQELLKNT